MYIIYIYTYDLSGVTNRIEKLEQVQRLQAQGVASLHMLKLFKSGLRRITACQV